MRNILFIVISLCMLSACGKEDDYTSENARLEGFWLLTEITGGFSGMGYEANFDHLQINEGQRYSLMIHDSFIQEGTYEWSEEEDQLIIRFIPVVSDTIPFDDFEKTVIFSDDDGKLTLTDPCCDLFTYAFSKEY